MIKHAWGWDSREPGYRTHYCTSFDDKNMIELVAKGFFYGPRHVGNMHDGYGMYYLTDEALKQLKEAKCG